MQMASGRTHTSATVLLTPLTAYAAWKLTGGDTALMAIAGAGCLSGIFISPDLDLSGKTISETLLNKWIIGAGWLWMLLWYPYARLSKHRGCSHVPIIGTLGRIVYLGIFYIGIHFIFQHYYATDLLVWPQLYWQQLLIFAGGLTVSDFGHWVLDKW